MGYVQASQYQPQVSTLAIRIYDSYSGSSNTSDIPLQPSPHYQILEYLIDDQDPDYYLENDPTYDIRRLQQGHALFTPELATQLLHDFEKSQRGCLELLVHCTLGGSRSPAIAIALNEIFQLGNDSEEMKERYKPYNQFVYRLLKEAANSHQADSR
ncbi:TPA: hypothetical protein HA234_01115 [Candidatus Woesearchaeota archaeon]|nr:hypothetical protein [Candidatus Woesearchaeota archaeon]